MLCDQGASWVPPGENKSSFFVVEHESSVSQDGISELLCGSCNQPRLIANGSSPATGENNESGDRNAYRP